MPGRWVSHTSMQISLAPSLGSSSEALCMCTQHITFADQWADQLQPVRAKPREPTAVRSVGKDH